MVSSVALKKVALLFILFISASLLSTPFSGMARKLMGRPAEGTVATKGLPKDSFQSGEEASVHHRSLTVRTDDYGNYNPTPVFEKPPPKPTPN